MQVNKKIATKSQMEHMNIQINTMKQHKQKMRGYRKTDHKPWCEATRSS